MVGYDLNSLMLTETVQATCSNICRNLNNPTMKTEVYKRNKFISAANFADYVIPSGVPFQGKMHVLDIKIGLKDRQNVKCLPECYLPQILMICFYGRLDNPTESYET